MSEIRRGISKAAIPAREDRMTASFPKIQKLFLIVFGIVFAFQVFSQNQYRGPYTLNNELHGEAHFQYRLSGNDTILDGPWSFNATLHDTLNDVFRGYQIEGEYIRGQRVGEWNYRATQFNALQEPRVEGYKLVRHATGTEYTVTGRFEKGRAHGEWHVVSRSIINGNIEETRFQGNVIYSNGIPSGNLQGYSSNLTVTGEFNERGFLNGNWRFIYKQPRLPARQVKRVYDNGILTGQLLIVDDREHELRLAGGRAPSPDGLDGWAEYPVDEYYFKILERSSLGLSPENYARLGLTPDSTSRLVRRSNELMSGIILAFSTHEGRPIWDMLPGELSFSPPRARVRRYPFTQEEQRLRSEVDSNYIRSMLMVERTLNDPRVDVASHADRDMAANVALLRAARERLQALEGVVEVITDPTFEYLQREQVLQHITPQINYPSVVLFEHQDRPDTAIASFPTALDSSRAGLIQIHDHLDQTLQMLESVATRTDQILAEQELWGTLGDKEQRLIHLRDSILHLYRDTDNNEYQQSFAPAMEKLALHGFSDYAASPDLETKTTRIDALLRCYDDAIHTYHRQGRIPQRMQQLDELYTRTIFNPYTFTYMDERMKERIYRAYEEILLPFVLEDARRNIHCGNLRSKQENIVRLYQKMMNLWEQDTTDISQRLRRVNDPQAVMEILSLELELN